MSMAPNMIAAMVMTFLGIIALLRPQAVGEFVGLDPIGNDGRAELRSKMGGFFIALGITALVVNDPYVYMLLGIGWAGSVMARIFSALADKAFGWRTIAGIGVELIIALMFFIRA